MSTSPDLIMRLLRYGSFHLSFIANRDNAERFVRVSVLNSGVSLSLRLTPEEAKQFATALLDVAEQIDTWRAENCAPAWSQPGAQHE